MSYPACCSVAIPVVTEALPNSQFPQVYIPFDMWALGKREATRLANKSLNTVNTRHLPHLCLQGPEAGAAAAALGRGQGRGCTASARRW